MKPKLSVVMPVWNGGKYLQPAIESILSQSYGDFEFIIVNDGSTDGSEEVIRSYKDSRIALVNNFGNLGLVKSLNKGLALASSELIARQDADDISMPQRFELQMRRFAERPELALLGAQMKSIDSEGRALWNGRWLPTSSEAIAFHLIFESAFIHSSTVFRKSVVLDELGGYSGRPPQEDYELFSKVAMRYKTENLPDTLVAYRILQSGITRSSNKESRARNLDISMLNYSFSLGSSDGGLEFLKVWCNLLYNDAIYDDASIDGIGSRIEGIKERFLKLHPDCACDAELEKDCNTYIAFAIGKLCYFSKMEAAKAAAIFAMKKPIALISELPRISYHLAKSLRRHHHG